MFNIFDLPPNFLIPNDGVSIIEETGENKGLNYFVIIQPAGWRCGYVEIPAHMRDREYYESDEVEAHGGITYEEDELNGVATKDEGRHFIGFDCAHFGDTPEKCTKEFVINECKSIIDQLLALYPEQIEDRN